MIRERYRLLALLRALHDAIARDVVAASEAQAVEALAAIVTDDDPSGDTIFALDRISEERLVAFFAEWAAPRDLSKLCPAARRIPQTARGRRRQRRRSVAPVPVGVRNAGRYARVTGM